MNADAVVYLDSSTLVKLVVREPESNALNLAAARALGDALTELITYDRRMATLRKSWA